MAHTSDPAAPVVALRREVTAYLTEMRSLGFDPNRSVSFCPDPHGEIPVHARGWLLVDPRTNGERWLLLDEGDVWHEVEDRPDAMSAGARGRYECAWLERPSAALSRLLDYSLVNEHLGGSGFLSDEERFSQRPYVVGDRRSDRGLHVGPERRRVARHS